MVPSSAEKRKWRKEKEIKFVTGLERCTACTGDWRFYTDLQCGIIVRGLIFTAVAIFVVGKETKGTKRNLKLDVFQFSA